MAEREGRRKKTEIQAELQKHKYRRVCDIPFKYFTELLNSLLNTGTATAQTQQHTSKRKKAEKKRKLLHAFRKVQFPPRAASRYPWAVHEPHCTNGELMGAAVLLACCTVLLPG